MEFDEKTTTYEIWEAETRTGNVENEILKIPIEKSERKKIFYPKTFVDAQLSYENQLKLESFRMQEIMRFDLYSRLAADLGLLVYTKSNLNISEICPRLVLNMGQYGNYEVLVGKNSKCVGLSKNILGTDIKVIGGKIHRNNYLEGSIEKIFDSGVKVQGSYTNSHQAYIKLKKFGEKYSVSVASKLTRITKNADISVSYNIYDKTSMVFGLSTMEYRNYLNTLRFGVKLRINSLTKLSYFFEQNRSSTIFRTVLNRGGFKLNIPIKVNRFPLAIGCIAIVSISYFSALLTKYFFDDNTEQTHRHDKINSEDYLTFIKEKAELITSEEIKNDGLVIIQALYGNQKTIERINEPSFEISEDVIDVTIQLRFLVSKSSLSLPSSSKANMQGFYKVFDPAVLYIKYKLHNKIHNIMIKDNQPLVIK